MATVPLGKLVAAQCDPPRPARGVGVIAPFDFVLDEELRAWLPRGCPMFITRTHALARPVDIEFAEQVSASEDLFQASRDLATAEPAVVAYACTSGSFVGGLAGEARVRASIERGGAHRAVTTSGALLEALAALGVRRVGLGTPYERELSERLCDFVREAGWSPVSLAYLGLDRGIFRVARETAVELAHEAAAGAEAVFLSCTNLPTIDLLPELEAQLRIPVLSANLVTVWAALRAAGISSPPRPERLFAA